MVAQVAVVTGAGPLGAGNGGRPCADGLTVVPSTGPSMLRKPPTASGREVADTHWGVFPRSRYLSSTGSRARSAPQRSW